MARIHTSATLPTASVTSVLNVKTAQNQCRSVLGFPMQKVWTPADVIRTLSRNDREVSAALWKLGQAGLVDGYRFLRYAYNWMAHNRKALTGEYISRVRGAILAKQEYIGYLTNLANGINAAVPVSEVVTGAVRSARPDLPTAQRMAMAAGFGWAHDVAQIPGEPVWNPATDLFRPSNMFA